MSYYYNCRNVVVFFFRFLVGFSFFFFEGGGGDRCFVLFYRVCVCREGFAYVMCRWWFRLTTFLEEVIPSLQWSDSFEFILVHAIVSAVFNCESYKTDTFYFSRFLNHFCHQIGFSIESISTDKLGKENPLFSCRRPDFVHLHPKTHLLTLSGSGGITVLLIQSFGFQVRLSERPSWWAVEVYPGCTGFSFVCGSCSAVRHCNCFSARVTDLREAVRDNRLSTITREIFLR